MSVSHISPSHTAAHTTPRHAACDGTAAGESVDEEAPEAREGGAGGTTGAQTPPPSDGGEVDIGSSAALISVCTIISRITGFLRTWAMAFALGSTMLASSYQVANNLPDMLYELVLGGMVATAFLPVYVSVKDRLGERGGNDYASNLFSITLVFLGIVALVCSIFSPALIFTQSFMSDQSTMDDAIFFFRFFALQIVFYGISAIVGGLLNASRDYLWSSAAPIFNNIIVTATFLLYAFVAPYDSSLAKLIIAIGNPLGVFTQMAIQIPALKRNGIKLRFHIDLHDPALKETVTIGLPALVVTAAGLIVVSVQNSAAYGVLDNGPSVIAYARLWFTLPYSFLTVPITTAMFTEISIMCTREDMEGFKRGIASGTKQIVFFLAPFMLYLIVFSTPLVTLYHIGAFTEENITQIASYLAVLAISLPLYGVSTYMQKAFSALREMKVYSLIIIAASVLQIAFIMLLATDAGGVNFGMSAIAISGTLFYAVIDFASFAYLHRKLGPMGGKSILASCLRSLALGAVGAIAGALVMSAVQIVAPLNGSIINALACIICGGIVSLIVTFGIALKLGLEEASLLSSIVGKLTRRMHANASDENGESVAEDATAEDDESTPVENARHTRDTREDASSDEKSSLGKHAARRAPAHARSDAADENDGDASRARHAKR